MLQENYLNQAVLYSAISKNLDFLNQPDEVVKSGQLVL